MSMCKLKGVVCGDETHILQLCSSQKLNKAF